MANLANPLILVNFETEEAKEAQQRKVAAALIAGAEARQLEKAERRCNHRAYLTRRDLLPNPRINTPWQQLYQNHRDQAYFAITRVNTAAFEAILEGGF